MGNWLKLVLPTPGALLTISGLKESGGQAKVGSPGAHPLVRAPPLDNGWDLCALLPKRIPQRWREVHGHVDVNYIQLLTAVSLRDSAADFEEARCHIVKVMRGEQCSREPRVASDQQLARHGGPQSLHHQEAKASDNHARAKVDPSPVRPPQGTPARTSTAA